jgi:hypothetical protein
MIHILSKYTEITFLISNFYHLLSKFARAYHKKCSLVRSTTQSQENIDRVLFKFPRKIFVITKISGDFDFIHALHCCLKKYRLFLSSVRSS